MPILEIRKLTKYFGGLGVLRDVDINVQQGEILGLIGPNGAGKSTLFNTIVGIHKPQSGDIIFENKSIVGLRPNQIAKRGIIKTYQANVLFRHLTVAQNLTIGHHLHIQSGLFGVFFNSSKAREATLKAKRSTAEILGFFDLLKKQNELAGDLPHGYQRLLGMAMAVAAKPKLLLLDEPVTGMNPEEALSTVELIRRLQQTGITIVIVEHDMKVVMNLCERIVVIHLGEKIAQGYPETVRANRDVIEAYLGVD